MITNNNMLSNKVWAILVVILFALQITANALASIFVGATGLNVGQISDANPTFLTPDGVTFSVWGLIYTLLLLFTIYQALPSHFDDEELVAVRPIAITAFALNGTWLFLWTNGLWWVQWLDIVLYLVALAFAYYYLKVNYMKSEKVWQYIFCINTGISANLAWATVATAVSTTATLRVSGWVTKAALAGEHDVGATVDWALMWIVVVTGVSTVLAIVRADIVHNLVTAWALSGIVRMQTHANPTSFPVSLLSPQVADWALAAEIVVLCAAGVSLIQIIYNGYVSRQRENNLALPMLDGARPGGGVGVVS